MQYGRRQSSPHLSNHFRIMLWSAPLGSNSVSETLQHKSGLVCQDSIHWQHKGGKWCMVSFCCLRVATFSSFLTQLIPEQRSLHVGNRNGRQCQWHAHQTMPQLVATTHPSPYKSVTRAGNPCFSHNRFPYHFLICHQPQYLPVHASLTSLCHWVINPPSILQSRACIRSTAAPQPSHFAGIRKEGGYKKLLGHLGIPQKKVKMMASNWHYS